MGENGCPISVIIPTYGGSDYLNLCEAISSLKCQTIRPEIIVVVGGAYWMVQKLKMRDDVDAVIFDEFNLGVAHARNMGVKAASGEIVAFLDDDELAIPEWCEELLCVYECKSGCGGVGGCNKPLWGVDENVCLPEEFYWLVGVTHRNYIDMPDQRPVRNTFGGNISFRKCLFEEVGGFNKKLGFENGNLLQGEEVEICDKLRNVTGQTFWCNPKAIVYNRVPPYKLSISYLVRRSFWQGYTKSMLEQAGHALTVEKDYLSVISIGFKERLLHPTKENIIQLFYISILTCMVGIGYMMKSIPHRTK